MDTVPSRQDGFFSTMIIVEMLPKELGFSGVVISAAIRNLTPEERALRFVREGGISAERLAAIESTVVSLTLPPFLAACASRGESATVVVAYRGKNASARSFSVRRRTIFDLAAQGAQG
jgi:hypothetical protein